MGRRKGQPSPHRGKGRGLAWLKDHLNHDGEECLIFPWSRNHQGYGQIGYFGKVRKAHHIMCLLAKGAPPTPRHHAAHSCLNGHLGCVHPKHLDWKTPTENRLEARPAPKRHRLPVETVLFIKNSPKSYLEISAETGVYFGTVGKIKRGELYKNLALPTP